MVKKSPSLAHAPAGVLPQGRILAAPSWVMRGSLPENCRFLAGKVDEAGLLFFEAESCLAYGSQDLPEDLSALPLRWHVHLPLDLAWDGERAVETCLALMDKAAFLGAERAVLHPPAGSLPQVEAMLSGFAARWAGAGRDTGCILLENTAEQSLVDLHECIADCGLGVCLDLGHMLAYGQQSTLDFLPLTARAGMVHLNALAPSAGGRHSPLTSLDAQGRSWARRLCGVVPKSAVIMLELFSWDDIAASLPLVRAWLEPGELSDDGALK